MTIQSITGGLWIPSSFPSSGSAPAYTTLNTINSAAIFAAYIFQVPKTGTLDLFEVRQQANSNTPDNGLRFSFQDLDASGNPDNTDDQYAVVTSGFGNGAWLIPSGYMGAGGTATGAKRSVTRGDWLACVIKMESFVALDSIATSKLDFTAVLGVNGGLNRYLATTSNSGATWGKNIVGGICVALKYDDGTYATAECPYWPVSAFNTRTFNSADTPDEIGLLFQVPFPARLTGCWARLDTDNALDIVLYDSGSSVVSTITVDNVNVHNTVGANGVYIFDSAISLTKNVNYRLVVKPGASNIVMYDLDFNSQAIRESIDGGSTWMKTSRTNAGAWTDTNTNRPLMGLIFDGFDDAASGGGGEHSAVF